MRQKKDSRKKYQTFFNTDSLQGRIKNKQATDAFVNKNVIYWYLAQPQLFGLIMIDFDFSAVTCLIHLVTTSEKRQRKLTVSKDHFTNLSFS